MDQNTLQVWNETRDKLRALAYRYTKDSAVADDLVQDVFLKVHSSVSSLKSPEKMTHWLFRVTKNAITDHFRSKSRAMPYGAVDWESDRKEMNECVERCLEDMLGTLPEKYQEAIKLADMKNVSQLDLARKLNISYSGAKSRVQRARQMLKEKMESSYRIELDNYGNVVVCEDRSPCGCPQDGHESP